MSIPTVTAARIFKGQFFSESGTMEAGAYTKGRGEWGKGPFKSPSSLEKSLFTLRWKYFRQHCRLFPKKEVEIQKKVSDLERKNVHFEITEIRKLNENCSLS